MRKNTERKELFQFIIMKSMRYGLKRIAYLLRVILFFIVFLLLSTCTSVPSPYQTTPLSEKQKQAFYFAYPQYSYKVKSLYLSLSVEERIAQLLIINLKQMLLYNTYELDHQMARHLSQIKPGGVILFSINIRNEKQLKQLTSDITAHLDVPPFISIDVEGGSVNRLNNLRLKASSLPDAQTLAITESTTSVQTLMYEVGQELASLGINMNFAPVADIRYPNTPSFLTNRIFADTPQRTAEYVGAVVEGLDNAGIISVAKHFPGHGSTKSDTHHSLGRIQLSRDALMKADFIPFKKAIDKGVPAIMMGHLSAPALDVTGQLVETSQPVVDLLRNILNFDGVIISDSLLMGAVGPKYVGENFAEEVLNAGVTILLDPPNAQSLHEKLIRSFYNGELSGKRMQESVLKVLDLKEQYGLLE